MQSLFHDPLSDLLVIPFTWNFSVKKYGFTHLAWVNLSSTSNFNYQRLPNLRESRGRNKYYSYATTTRPLVIVLPRAHSLCDAFRLIQYSKFRKMRGFRGCILPTPRCHRGTQLLTFRRASGIVNSNSTRPPQQW